MGESRKKALRVEFDKSVKLEFHGAKISSGARKKIESDESVIIVFAPEREAIGEWFDGPGRHGGECGD